MGGIEVLVLHGSPGAGKSTLARALSELLRSADRPHAVIDLDDLSLIHPYPRRSFPLENLAAIWPNYAAVSSELKVLIPTVVADVDEREQLRAAVQGSRLLIAELTAPQAVLKARVTEREPTEEWRKGLRNWVDIYHRRTDLAQLRDFLVDTHERSVVDAAGEILVKAGWRASFAS